MGPAYGAQGEPEGLRLMRQSRVGWSLGCSHNYPHATPSSARAPSSLGSFLATFPCNAFEGNSWEFLYCFPFVYVRRFQCLTGSLRALGCFGFESASANGPAVFDAVGKRQSKRYKYMPPCLK